MLDIIARANINQSNTLLEQHGWNIIAFWNQLDNDAAIAIKLYE
jgi:hypothetical protein